MSTNRDIHIENKESRRYIVVTACKDEEGNLPYLVQSITAQTIRPALWVIVNDGSADKTGKIISEAKKKYEWIKGVHLKEHKEYMGTHIAYVCNKGFEFAKEYCERNDISYEYIALVDADNILEVRYFEKLIGEFEKDEKVGIASGNNAWTDVEKLLNELKRTKKDVTVMDSEFWQMYDSPVIQIGKGREDLPIGSARMWRKKCFEETGGYAPVHAPDAVSNIKAKIKGWKTRRFRNIKLIEREGLTAKGSWKGYKRMGKSDFFRWYPFSFTLLKALNYLSKRPYYSGFAYFWGYLIESLISRKNRIDDAEIQQYYQYIRPNEQKAYYKEKIKRLFKKLIGGR